jgi:hypothetical protein
MHIMAALLILTADHASFETVSRIALDFEDRFVLGISSYFPGEQDDWFVAAFEDMDGGSVTLYRFNQDGEIEKEFGKHGQGPGELRGSIGMVRHKDFIYAAEGTHRVIHVYDLDFNHIRDIKTTMVGKVKLATDDYVGIWYPNPAGADVSHMVTAIPLRDDLEKKSFVVIEKDRVPILVHSWGDITELPDGRFASVLGNQYRVRLHNADFSPAKTIIDTTPEHVTPYHAFKGDTKVIGQEAFDWMWSFTKYTKILYDGSHLIVIHLKEKDGGNFADFIDLNGKFHRRNVPIGNRIPRRWVGDIITRLGSKEEGEETAFTILTERVSFH